MPDSPSPAASAPLWLVEEGIGEDRAICIEGGRITRARLQWDGEAELNTGLVAPARLVTRTGPRGTARLADGREVLVSRLPPAITQGAACTVEITRPAMAEQGRFKRAQGVLTQKPPAPAPPLAASLRAEGHAVQITRSFPAGNALDGDWDALVADAFARHIPFTGGALLLIPTPAMTLVDVDGDLPPAALALAAPQPLADALARLDIGGSIGVDFPTLPEKPQRRAVDDALEQALAAFPHERTAMNGFGFVQIAARLARISILHRAAFHGPALAARLALRRAERLEGAGSTEIAGHPALGPHLAPALMEELARRTGRPCRFRADPALAIEAPNAQLVPS